MAGETAIRQNRTNVAIELHRRCQRHGQEGQDACDTTEHTQRDQYIPGAQGNASSQAFPDLFVRSLWFEPAAVPRKAVTSGRGEQGSVARNYWRSWN